MPKKLKVLSITIVLLLIIVFTTMIAGNMMVRNKLEHFIEKKLPDHISASYKELDLHLLTGTLTFNDVTVALLNKTDKRSHTTITAEQIIIEELSYWEFLLRKKVHIEDIRVVRPNLNYAIHQLNQTTQNDTPKGLITLHKPLLIDALRIDDATITILDGTKDSTKLFVPKFTLEVDSIYTDQETLQKRLPITFGQYRASTDSIFLKVSPYENVTVQSLNIEHHNAVIEHLKFFTRYSPTAYHKILKTERDHYKVDMDRLTLEAIDFGFLERKFFAKSTHVTSDSLVATIYRNKLIADDLNAKPLYSEMLRKLPIALSIDSLSLNHSKVTYKEKVKASHPPGIIYFDDLNLAARQIGNTYPKGELTSVKIHSKFMNTTPLKVDWSFDVSDANDSFTFNAELDRLKAKEMNSFTKPNLSLALEGEVDKTYFSIYGNKAQSSIDMKMKYETFKVNLLDEDGNHKKKFLSGLLNIFVKKNSKNSDGEFRSGSATVRPDKTKSFFNYIWLNVRDGIKECML